MKRIVSFIVVFTLVMGGMTHVQAQSKAVEKAEKKLERKEKKDAGEAPIRIGTIKSPVSKRSCGMGIL